jgi:hypothetical protein
MFWDILTSYKQTKMIEFIPYFTGIVSILFGVAFAYAKTSYSKKDK